jgi:hypothetical protein
MTYFRPITATVVAISLLLLGGCNTPDTISQFCGASITTLNAANAVFDDMKQSCLREVNSRQELGTFKPPLQSDTNCTAIGTQVEGAKAAAQLVSGWFTVINSLASFNTAKTGTDAGALATQTSAAFGAGSDVQNAVGSIVTAIASALTSGYQQRQLARDLPAVSGNITTVMNGLVKVIRDDYIGRLLASEEQKLADQYQGFVQTNSRDKPISPDLKLALYDRWQTQEAAIAAKRVSARNLISGLHAISQGLAELSANANKLTAKELPGLLAPYVSEIQALIPVIQKAF